MTSRVVGVVPPDDSLSANRLFEPTSSRNRDDVMRPWRRLREMAATRDIDLQTWDMVPRARAVVSWDRVVERPQVPWFFYILEPPVVRPDLYRRVGEFRTTAYRLFTHSLEIAAMGGNARHFSYPQIPPVATSEGFGTRQPLVAMINANKRPLQWTGELYSKRVRVAAGLAREGAIHVYGPGWDGLFAGYARAARVAARSWFASRPTVVGPSYPAPVGAGPSAPALVRGVAPVLIGAALTAPAARTVRPYWKGLARSKHEVLSSYDFCLAFENAVSPGFITEKVFDAMFSGAIPVYLGDPAIESVLPAQTYVDYREFDSPQSLWRKLEAMPQEERAARREAIRSYLGNDAFSSRFGIDAWVTQLLDELEPVL